MKLMGKTNISISARLPDNVTRLMPGGHVLSFDRDSRFNACWTRRAKSACGHAEFVYIFVFIYNMKQTQGVQHIRKA